MRIIAGKHRGLKLVPFAGKEIRPTSDRVKESVFQILSDRLEGARVLDLFAGSGALGLECLSRGAGEVVFNDHSAESLAVLRKNLAAAKESAKVYRLDYLACLKTVAGPFDLIFCDPPYRMDCMGEILTLVAKRELLSAGGLVVAESERKIAPPCGFEEADARNYGRTSVVFFKRSQI